MTARKVIRRIMARRTQLTLLSAAAIVCFIATAILTTQVFLKLGDYRTAYSDNIQWTVAKLEVEHAKYVFAVERLGHETGNELQEMRRRFDIFYSRVNTLETARTYRQVLSAERARSLVMLIGQSVREQAKIIDGDDASVRRNQPHLLQLAQDLTTPILSLSSMGISYDVDRRETQRTLLAKKLTQLILLSLSLLTTLFALLALFWQLYVRYRRRAMQNRTTLNRLATIINTSQDAILVICPSGAILEGNRVAEAIFDLPHDDKSRAAITDILFKANDEGTLMPVSGETLIGSCAQGPNLCTKLNARDKTGRTFPVELSASMASRSGDNVCICFLRDISQRVATEAEMHAARDKALAGERAKARFLGMISHEMRTPLNGILGALDLLDDTPLTPEQTRYSQIMQSSGQLVLNQINDALDIAQADGKYPSLSKERFDLDALLDELRQGQQAHADAQQSAIELIRSPIPLGPVLGDQNRLHQVLLNLLSNAVKFTRNGQVIIEATRLGAPGAPRDEVEFQISDTGIGIAEQNLPRIFDDFVRLEDIDSAEGTGLGLGIAKHLVTLMGGEIGAESVHEEGSLFWVRVPLPIARDIDVTIPGPEIHHLPPRILSVLVAEDNETSRFVLHEMLQKDGHYVTLTNNGAEAVAAAYNWRFDLILMDINMPGIDGIEASRQIRNGNGASRDSRIVALTAHYRPEHNERFRDVPIDSICTKPLRRAALRDILSGGPVRERPPATRTGFDTQVLDQLCAVLPAPNFSRILDKFIAEGQGFINALQDTHDRPSQDLAGQLHQFAGSAATFGAVALQSALCRAENAALADDKTCLDRELSTLPDLWRQTIDEINNRRYAA